MQTKEFIENLEKMNFSLSVKEGKLFLKGDRNKLSAEKIEAIKTNSEVIGYIKNHKDELIDYISSILKKSDGHRAEKSVVELFEEQVKRNPEALAVVFEDKELSYGELNRRSNQLAHYLMSEGVSAGTLVPICLERGLEMIVGVIGILKAGGAYVPIDPAYPQERIGYMLEDTGAMLVLSNTANLAKVNGTMPPTVIAIDGHHELIKTENNGNPDTVILPGQLAYVIYTSGSTGRPKGVMIEHQSLINYLLNNKTRYINEKPGTAGSFVHLSYTFDASITALFMPLLSGKYLVIASNDRADVFTDKNLEKYAPYDFIKITPSHLALLPAIFKNAEGGWLTGKLVIGGEALRLSQFDSLIKEGIQVEVINEYGPTEATVGCSTYSFHTLGDRGFTQNEVPIGKPISNTRIHILSGNNTLSPIGVPGELCIGGTGLARGYLNKPELTAAKFVKDPLSNEASAKLYRTGDLGRWMPDGNIEYLGRIDDQVKIRGYRIELGEIESVLNSSEDISQGVVLAKDDKQGNKRLVGYVVAGENFDRQNTQAYLNSKLPEYMIPALWVELDIFPLTPNGKIDRKALPDPEMADSTAEYAAPRNETEATLVVMWQDLLEIDKVGITDDFFELGGQSLLVIRLISAIRKTFGIELQLNDVFDHPTIALLAKQLGKESLEELLPPVVIETPRPEYTPLSFSQERLWFIDKLEGSVQYHLPSVLRLRGRLNCEALENTLRDIINRHEILRTVIHEHEEIGHQYIIAADQWSLGLKEELASDGVRLASAITGLISKPFDLSQDYMLRADLIKRDEEDHILVVTMHHIASDGWSTSILVKEVIALYESYSGNRQIKLPVVSIQYADYAIWQRKYMRGEILESKLNYWKSKLQGVLPLQLPTDYGRPPVQSSRGAVRSFNINAELTAQLVGLSQSRGATLYMTLLTAFKVLLYRYSGQEDICVGTPVAGRNQQELEGLIGFFINTLALRSQVRGDISFTELLQEVKNTTLEAYSYQEVPFEKVVDVAVKDRDMSRNPLFQVLFSLQNTPDLPQLKLGELQLTSESREHTTSKFDLSLFLRETDTGIHGMVEYATDLYKIETIERLISHYINLLGSIVAAPEKKIGRLGMLTVSEEKTLLLAFNDTHADYAKDKNIVSLFEEQVKRTPQQTAVVFGQERLTYATLNERSNQLAHYLLRQGVTTETLVPVCIERSPEMVIGILGILKAGGAYVPIDPEYPADRISYMLEDTGASIILSSSASREHLQGKTGVKVIELDKDRSLIEEESANNINAVIPPEQLAYVIYTSGSTGKPKGVMIEHRNVNSFIAWSQHEFSTAHFDIAYATTSICFDLSVFELFYPLTIGKPVRILENGLAIPDYLTEDSFVLINTVPSVMESLLNDKTDLSRVSVINMAGEPIPARVQESLNTTKIEVRNLYGPTEYTTYSTICRLESGKPVTIGKPISNTRVYILSDQNALTPVGVTGEICIGGAGLARGYLNRHELTREKFIKDPFGDEPKAKLYKTGDLGRWLPDGDIEYLGRKDYQVKIRGYRIELGEIDNVLNQSGFTEQAVVLAKEDSTGIKRLVAYVVPSGTFDKQEIQSFLGTKLPGYMVPAIWVEMDSLPLTPNGKIDRKALPDPDLRNIAAIYVEPRNETEAKLAEIWQALLNVEQVSVFDNFFELGGHSLLAMRVVSAIRRELEVELAIKDLFIYPTIDRLGAYLDEQTRGLLLPAITATERPEYIPLSFSQERLWFIDNLEGSLQYHLPAVLRLKGELNADALEHTLRSIINRHEVLRTVIREHDGQGYQYIMPATDWTLTVTDALPATETSLSKYIAKLTGLPFNLADDYMLRAELIRIADQDHILAVTTHHIASDGWSTSILVKEVAGIYEAFIAGEEPQLPSLPIQYADYAIWQRGGTLAEILESKLSYWKEQLEGVTPLQLATDYTRPALQSARGATHGFKIDKQLAARLQTLSQAQGATMYMTLLAAVNVLLYRYSGQEDICVGTPVSGRNQQELEGLIGFFINTLALRSQVAGDVPFDTFLEEIKTTTLQAYSHQDVPFAKVVDAVVKTRDMSRSPLFQVLVSLQNTPDVPALKLGELQLSAESQERTTTQFELAFMMNEAGSGINGTIVYAIDLYKEETIEQMASHYMALLESIAGSPDTEVGHLCMLTEREENTLLKKFNDTEADYPKNKSLVDLFAEQAVKTPKATAIVFEGQELSYKQLDERSNQLARYLINQGVRAETLVAVCLERSIEMMVGILAILKAGGAYVPIDPEYPQERISYMLEDTGAKLILSSGNSKEKISDSVTKIIAIDSEWDQISKEQTTNPQIVIRQNQLAYVIYTSGSTGKPKGAMNEHDGIVNRLLWTQDYFKLSSKDAVLQKTTFCFDVSVWELFWPIITGAKLVFAKPGAQGDNIYLKSIIDSERITLVHFVPSMLGAFLSDLEKGDCKGLKDVLCSGEALAASQLQLFDEKLPNAKLHNLYGPTEAAIDVSCWSYNNGEVINTVPIGKPVANTQLYILNADKQLCPIGVPGELHIGGVQVGRGYLNRPELTIEKFVKDQFSDEPNAKLYRTGDLARWRPDGNIEYLGRTDDQVKIRGYRIELGEIENVLKQSGLVNQAVILAKADKQGTKRLLGYVVSKGEFDKMALENYLTAKVPEYMVPALWVALESIPLTSNGKIDRKALPDPQLETRTTVYVAPRNETEAKLVAIWKELLDVERVGVYDNFFELGGHSVLAIRVASSIRKEFSISIPIRTLFSFASVSDLSKYLELEIQTMESHKEKSSGEFDVVNI